MKIELTENEYFLIFDCLSEARLGEEHYSANRQRLIDIGAAPKNDKFLMDSQSRISEISAVMDKIDQCYFES